MAPVFVKIKGKEHLVKGQSYVIVANHRSSFDILIVYAFLGLRFKWVMKKELRKVPGLGYGSKAIGHIFIDRSNTKKAIESMKEAGKKIKNGVSVFFFPEGTRSKTGALLPFKKGAFYFAVDLGLPILPVSINGTDRILPSDTFNLFPGKAEIIFHPPIDIAPYTKENIPELIQRVRTVIESGLRDRI
jgi:1-acyl-sn-glycerol-3-phosphate acyltransferase